MAKIETVPAEYTVSLNAEEWTDLRNVFQKAVRAERNNSPIYLYNSEESLATSLFGREFWDTI